MITNRSEGLRTQVNASLKTIQCMKCGQEVQFESYYLLS